MYPAPRKKTEYEVLEGENRKQKKILRWVFFLPSKTQIW